MGTGCGGSGGSGAAGPCRAKYTRPNRFPSTHPTTVYDNVHGLALTSGNPDRSCYSNETQNPSSDWHPRAGTATASTRSTSARCPNPGSACAGTHTGTRTGTYTSWIVMDAMG